MTKVLIWLNLLPVQVKDDYTVASFSWHSMRTFLFLLFSFSPMIAVGISWLVNFQFFLDYFEQCSKLYITFEILIVMTFYTVFIINGPINILCICKPLSELKEITLKRTTKGINIKDRLELGLAWFLGNGSPKTENNN